MSVEEKFALLSKIQGYDGRRDRLPLRGERRGLDPGPAEKVQAEGRGGQRERQGRARVPQRRAHLADKAVRDKAVRFIKEAKDFAEAVGADKVTCCPLGDGYEFAFQCDYARDLEAPRRDLRRGRPSYKPKIPLFIEYKPSETRGTLLPRLRGQDALPAQRHRPREHRRHPRLRPLHLRRRTTRPRRWCCSPRAACRYYIHINDNDGKWDWDYFCGTKHFLEYVEFLYYLQEVQVRGLPHLRHLADALGHQGRPSRPTAASRTASGPCSTRSTTAAFAGFIAGDDYLKTWKFIEKEIFGLK